jgi:chromosome segregation ATPase
MRAGDAASAALSAETAAAKVELEALLAAKSAASAATAALAAQEDEQAQKRHEHRSLAQKLAHSIAAATAKMKALQTAVASLERAAAKAAAKATKGRNSFAEEEVGEAGGGCTVASVQKEVIGLLAEESAHRDELRALKGAKAHASGKASGKAAASSLANRGTLKAKVAKVATLQTQMASVSQAIEHLETGIGECAEVMRGANRKCFDQVSSSFATQVGQLCPGKTGLIEAVNPDDLADGLSLFVTAGDKRAERKSNVLELSGGQKALVGLALTFALSAHRRLPLYILDEIDAPLDEHNQAAAADAIAEVFRGSQVLCVSHHAPFHRKADHIIQISRQNEASKLMRCVDQTQGGTKRREAAGATTATASKRRLQ